MATLPTTDERLASAIAILRTGGHEPEARAIEALVEEQVRTRSSDCQRLTAPAISIVAVAECLGETPAQVRRRLELGMLTAAGEDASGDELVTRKSLEALLDSRRSFATIAEFPFTAEDEESEASSSTLLAQMLAFVRERDERS